MVWDYLKVYGPILAVVVAGFVVAWQFVDPAPPRMLRMASGAPDGAYAAFASRYASILAKDGVKLQVVPSEGSVENLALLTAKTGGVDVAFVQGGIGDPSAAPGLVSLASVFFEPVWLFARADLTVDHLRDLSGRRIAVGTLGSGTRSLALQLLAANGVTQDTATFLAEGGAAAATSLLGGAADAAFYVTARPSAAMNRLLRAPSVRLLSFGQAAAYARRFPFLEELTLPEALLDFAADIPPKDITMLAPAATLVARADLHPALIDLLLGAATQVHGAPGLFQEEGQFPSARYVDFPLSDDARRYFKSGPTFLRRYLPFGWAVLVERLAIMLVPLVTLMIPLFRIAPPAYRWRVRSKVFRWYKELRALEARIRDPGEAAPIEELAHELDRLQEAVGRLVVPIGYSDILYNLRLHIEFVRERILGRRSYKEQSG